MLLLFSPTEELYRLFQTVKGGLFVLATSGLLYVLIRREVQGNASLIAEREALLKELDHRVKNNLQVILSLLSIQNNGSNDADTNSLAAFEGRLRTLSAAHDLVGYDGETSSVPLGDHLSAILRQRHESPLLPMDARSSLNAYRITVDEAVPLGLIVHEAADTSFSGSDVLVEWSEDHDGDDKSTLSLRTVFHAKSQSYSPILRACLEQLSGSAHFCESSLLHVDVRLSVHREV